jgi:4-hydroxythreonine-4-phosphate dehydrogenase
MVKSEPRAAVRLAVTMGDPTGIGPELIVRALAPGGPLSPSVRDDVSVTLLGDRGVFERAAGLLGAESLAALTPGITLIETSAISPDVAPGSAESGRAQVAALEAAVRAPVDALVTAPIHKAACVAAGFAFPGHTELLAARYGQSSPLPVTMLFAGPRLRVALATIHVGLARVPALLTVDGLASTIVQTARALAIDFGVVRPRVAVAGLNPHAGERGLFGDEEERVVAPAIARAQAELGDAASVSGPHVPDAVFRDALDGARHDAVVALYHDQGLIPVKVIDFEEAVNVTLGLPIVRTSPDHGVAHDIAWQPPGRARPTSFFAAVRLALSLARHRARSRSASNL